MQTGSGSEALRGGPLVVLQFHKDGVLTLDQWDFVRALSEKVVKLGQARAGGDGVALGVQREVEWLPQRYTSRAVRWLRLLLVVLAVCATVPPTRKLIHWVTAPPVTSLSEALSGGLAHLACMLANWLWVGFLTVKKLASGTQRLLAHGKPILSGECDAATSGHLSAVDDLHVDPDDKKVK